MKKPLTADNPSVSPVPEVLRGGAEEGRGIHANKQSNPNFLMR